MIISTNWLNDYIAHGLTDDELADRLTMCGLEVESVETTGSSLEGVVIGHVLSREAHPDADRLSCCTVDVGSGEPLDIVCGAPNVAAGQRVAVATIGTTLHLPSRDNPTEKVAVTMKKAKIRGQESHGMICAEDELGLGDGHDGILVLDADAPIGTPFSVWLARKGVALTDSAIDISITPNRPDAISHLGIARDVSALTGKTICAPKVEIPAVGGSVSKRMSVSIEAQDACHRFVGILVEGVDIRESPDWMKQRLQTIGLRPRNVIVDITNYVMFECGQPLHAYDADTLAGRSIIVRKAKGGSTFTTLDSKERTLPAEALMICDAEREIGIAGIMGGENTEVTDRTTNVFIEAAWFEPSGIRRTAKALGLQTDASYRFERGVDAEGQAWAAKRAADLMVELAGGTLVDGMIDVHPVPYQAPVLPLRAQRVKDIVGADIAPSEMTRLLQAIGFGVAQAPGAPLTWQVTVPSFRPDVEREIDLVEEVVRLFGYDNIPEPTHSRLPNFTPGMAADRQRREQLRDVLSGLGFRETCTNSMLPTETAARFNVASLPAGRFAGAVVETLNPITTEMSALRPSLLPGLLKVAGHNQNHGQTAIRMFEFGRVHTKRATDRTLVGDYTETETLLLLATGHWETGAWNREAREVDLFDLKGVVDRLIGALGLERPRYKEREADAVAAWGLDILIGKRWIGSLLRVSDAAADGFSLRSAAFVAELDFTSLADVSSQTLRPRFQAISRFPVVERDIAVVVDAAQAAGPMVEAIHRAGGDWLRGVTVFDLYEGEHVGTGQKSLAFGLRLGADRTLQDKEVDKTVERILRTLDSEFGAKLRG
ncbi:MAG: phenylalanine--tRNA ligase subunit beta [Bacteroidetes bacterium]|nr:phenylalanine--tRNA ligase subunit beta [Bacteroidota bacterium]